MSLNTMRSSRFGERRGKVGQLTQQRIGIATPNSSVSVQVKCSPAVSTSWGRASAGNRNREMHQPAQLIVNGSKNPVADAEDTSVMWTLPPSGDSPEFGIISSHSHAADSRSVYFIEVLYI